jgi:hypothetical protein
MPPEINCGARGALEALLTSKHSQELVFGDLDDATTSLTDSEREDVFYTLSAELRDAMWNSIEVALKKERGL